MGRLLALCRHVQLFLNEVVVDSNVFRRLGETSFLYHLLSHMNIPADPKHSTRHKANIARHILEPDNFTRRRRESYIISFASRLGHNSLLLRSSRHHTRCRLKQRDDCRFPVHMIAGKVRVHDAMEFNSHIWTIPDSLVFFSLRYRSTLLAPT